MLHLYSNPEFRPEGTEYVRDNEEFFRNVTVYKVDSRVNGLLKNTDGAVYQDEFYFRDKFGCSVPWECLSTGGKTVLNVFYNPDVCFDTIECGMNALTDMKNLREGMIYPNHLQCDDGVDDVDIIIDDNADYRYHSYRGWQDD